MPSDDFLKSDAFPLSELLGLATEAAGLGVWKVDLVTRAVEMSAASKRMLGLPADNLKAAEPRMDDAGCLALIYPDDRDATRHRLAAALAAPDGRCAADFRVVRPAGDIRHLSVNGQVFFAGDGDTRKATMLIGTLRDITDAKPADDGGQGQLHEVNHRVKNSLQLVSSLLRLQARRVLDPEARRQMEGATTRISTIAHIHQRLYRDQDPDRINFGAFLSELCADLQGSAPQCSIEVLSPEFRLTVDRAIPLALAVNELVTNAFSHAYPPVAGKSGGGRVTVGVELLDGGKVAVAVRDEGVGLPGDFTVAGGPHLGMLLIANLLNQLSGTLEVRPVPIGACFVVTASIAS